ncbi:glutamate--cysteine ligase [Ningiella sp. W23]|uniref:glutamate--cysteine ligase n=1 Tax=Ningiella sp. W23 TaxID=3023715 RepID=UPI003756C4EB
MGQAFDKDSFTPDDHIDFRKRLQTQLSELKPLLNTPEFSDDSVSLGAELELYILDSHGLPAPKNMQLLDIMSHPLLNEELNKFNLEFNLSPVGAKGVPFSAMTNEISPFLRDLKKQAQELDSSIASIGILPTLKAEHLQRQFMTDLPRYRALTNELSALKGEPFLVDINGIDSLNMHCDEVTLEGANTSFQVHLKVPANNFANLYNATQLTTPLVLALAGNSPTFLGNKLWHETRIALFKQSIDNRIHDLTQWRQPARVSFGHGWVREGAWELFAQNVALYCPILPFVSPEDKPFAELNLHHGTVWSWNRAVLEPPKPSRSGHLRIEYRTLPAGPTIIDMMANAAFAVGLTQALADKMDEMLPKITFSHAEYNFYRAAQSGLDANILWPLANQHTLKEQSICEVITQLLPSAADGLAQVGVDSSEINTLMNVIENRLANKQTGAAWQLACFDKHLRKSSKDEALAKMLQDYMHLSDAEQAVSTWVI